MARAVVVGAGLGGLAGAIALARRGWDVSVLERRERAGEVGAGIALWPNGLRALDALGLGDAVRAAGTVEGDGGIRDHRGRWLARTDAAALRRHQGDGVVVVDRPVLHDLLRAAAPPIETDTAVCSVDPGGPGPAVVHDVRGRALTADLVVAADGLRSGVRVPFWPEAVPRPTGRTAFRLIADHRRAAGGETWGRGDYVGLAPLPGDRTYLYAVVPTAEVPPRDALPWLRRRLAAWHDPIPAVLDAAASVAVHELADLRPPSSWHHGRVALLGDAAHAMTPNLGQGAGQAFLDAVVLAQEARADGSGLDRYEHRRARTARALARRSRRAGQVAGLRSPVAVAARNAMLRALPDTAAPAALDRLLAAERDGLVDLDVPTGVGR
ncbi:FAD-dependent monooxygenase [Actinomycetospora termitidis]|uniref:FAD-dependent monooxygenase n=1 Tax=Actinomycetospora termitidis TaxID=3053470 RepID=A0ABT7MC47_9PSEU|nr:FAD-dependent monooxygenase [Actinomycetospora sp. Odt1-22]MDL5158242.1 FAD-dependent monooxygenase [Actinomycetospora sp. Odt1-22]